MLTKDIMFNTVTINVPSVWLEERSKCEKISSNHVIIRQKAAYFAQINFINNHLTTVLISRSSNIHSQDWKHVLSSVTEV